MSISKKKKGLVFILVLCLALTMGLSFNTKVALAESTPQDPFVDFDLNDGGTVKAHWDQAGQKLTIDGNGKIDRGKWIEMAKKFDADNYSGDFRAWGYDNSDFHLEISSKDVQLPDDSSKLFKQMGGEITINPQINTSNVTNMYQVFARTKKANSDVSNWDTSNVENMGYMFWDAHMANPDVSKWITGKVTNMGFMFANTKVADPDLSNWNISNVTNMQAMFGHAKIADPDLSNWDTSNVESMEEMFWGAKEANPDVSNWDTSKVTNMAKMFGHTQKANPDVSNWDTSKVEDMSDMFYFAEVASPDVSNWETSSLTDTSGMFAGATAITELDLTNWDTSQIAAASEMFSGMSGLRFLEFKGLPANVFGPHYVMGNLISYAFDGEYIVRTINDKGDVEKQEGPFGEAEKYSFAKGLHYKVLPASQMAVTFDSRGGTAVPTQFVLIGTPAKKPDAPTKAGYAFTGWYEKEDATGEQWDFSTKIEGNVTLYAGWKAKAPGAAGTVKAVPKSPKTGDDSTGVGLVLLMMTGAATAAVALRRQGQR